MYSHQKNFKKAYDWTGKLRNRYLHTLATFRIYEQFTKLTAINIVGKTRAEKNAKLFGKNVYFFMPVKESCRCYFFVELAKFFDENRNKQSLTIEILLDFANKNLSSFSETQFLKFHSNRHFIPELFKDYKPLTIMDIAKLRNRLKRNKNVIENLKTYRDKFLAHDDIKKESIHISGPQIKTLLKIVRDTIDLFYKVLDFSSNMYDNYDKEPAFAVDQVVKNLQEHDAERMRKIMEEYKF